MIFSHVLYQLSYLGTAFWLEQEGLLRRSPEDEGEDFQYSGIPNPACPEQRRRALNGWQQC